MRCTGVDRMARLRPIPLGKKALQRANRDRFVDRPAPASRLARMRADTAADARHRIGIARVAISLFELPFRDERDVPAGVGLRRARHHARKVRVQPVAIDLLVSKPCAHEWWLWQRGSYLVSVKSAVAVPETVTGFDWVFMPSRHAVTV